MRILNVLVLISLVIFYVLFIGRTILLYKKGIKVWVIGSSTKNILEILLENILVPVLVFWSVFIIFLALNIKLPRFISMYLINFFWLKYVEIMFCYIGLLIFLLALISFGKAWRIGIDEKNSNELITEGIFKYTRNPIFLFMDMYFFGMALIYPNIVLIVMAICMIIGIHFQIIREEKFLKNKFHEKYNEYRKKTRRYF